MAEKAVYIGVFLTPDSKNLLLSYFPPKHQEIHADHMTIKFAPSELELGNTPISQKVKLEVIGVGHNDLVQAVLVRGVSSDNTHPHITISVNKREGGKAKYSNDLFEKGPGLIYLYKENIITIDGVVDTFPRTTTQQAQGE
jgi:hypothetical protein